MRPRTTLPVSIWLLAVAAVALTGSAVNADGEGESAAQFVFDVRVVQVRSDPATGLDACPWESGRSATSTSWTWPAALATLKARGQIFVQIDQRVTALSGDMAQATTEVKIPIERFDNRDSNIARHRYDNLTGGTTAKLTPQGDALDYSFVVKWFLWPSVGGQGVPSATTMWDGTHSALAAGETLVLHSRRHILDKAGEPEVAEIYCFVTGSQIAR
jgi:hypothetical protein